jgi:hypothetical protein
LFPQVWGARRAEIDYQQDFLTCVYTVEGRGGAGEK